MKLIDSPELVKEIIDDLKKQLAAKEDSGKAVQSGDLLALAKDWATESERIRNAVPKPYKPRCVDSFNEGIAACLYLCSFQLFATIEANAPADGCSASERTP